MRSAAGGCVVRVAVQSRGFSADCDGRPRRDGGPRKHGRFRSPCRTVPFADCAWLPTDWRAGSAGWLADPRAGSRGCGLGHGRHEALEPVRKITTLINALCIEEVLL